MEIRFLLAFLGLIASTTCREANMQCHACIEGICYGLNELDENNSDYNLMYFAYPNTNQINALNLTDYTVKTVLTADHMILGLALNQTSRDLYYSLDNGDFLKYNLVTNQTVSLFKPNSDNSGSSGFINFFILSGKLISTTNMAAPTLFKYIPEEHDFKLREPYSYGLVQLFDEPEETDEQRHKCTYYQRSRQLITISEGNETVLVHDGNLMPAARQIGGLGSYLTKGGHQYFELYVRRLYKLDHITREMVLVGAIEMPKIRSDRKDDEVMYVNSRTNYATPNGRRCVLKKFGYIRYKIEMLG